MPLGLENSAIPDSVIKSKKTAAGTLLSDARLGSSGGWCASPGAEVYLEVDLSSPHYICAIGTQGHRDPGNEAHVETYKVQLALRDKNYEFYKEKGTIKVCELTA